MGGVAKLVKALLLNAEMLKVRVLPPPPDFSVLAQETESK